ncbi:hypothetical protein Taro_039553, partial [Colocasia esculenta]|nr:hypothetical protein [Colocasia esculenta]
GARARVPKGARHGPAAVWSAGVVLVSLHCSLVCACGAQLDLSSVTVRLRGSSCVVLFGLDTGIMSQLSIPVWWRRSFRLVLCNWWWLVCVTSWLRFYPLWCALVFCVVVLRVPIPSGVEVDLCFVGIPTIGCRNPVVVGGHRQKVIADDGQNLAAAGFR